MPPSCSERARRARRGTRALGLAAALGLALGCSTLSVPQEQQLGEEFSREARREFTFVRDEVVVGYVDSIGQQIVRAAGPQPFRYHFYVIENDEINAFAGPGGHIYVHTGTILKARNVSELTGVIAHEVGHVAKRHIADNYERQKTTGALYQLGVVTAGVLGGQAAAGLANLGGGLAAMTYLNTFSRSAENEADAFAVETMPRAGYDPEGLVTFFQTLQRESGSGGPSFLSSHPATGDRIAHTQSLIDQVPANAGLRVDDDGKLEIIQRRVRLLTGDPATRSRR